jgi:hypothetical protein
MKVWIVLFCVLLLAFTADGIKRTIAQTNGNGNQKILKSATTNTGHKKSYNNGSSDFYNTDKGKDTQSFDNSVKNKKATHADQNGNENGDLLQRTGTVMHDNTNGKLRSATTSNNNGESVKSTNWNLANQRHNDNGRDLESAKQRLGDNDQVTYHDLRREDNRGSQFNNNNGKFKNAKQNTFGNKRSAAKTNQYLNQNKRQRTDDTFGDLLSDGQDTGIGHKNAASNRQEKGNAQHQTSRNRSNGHSATRKKGTDLASKKKGTSANYRKKVAKSKKNQSFFQ